MNGSSLLPLGALILSSIVVLAPAGARAEPPLDLDGKEIGTSFY